MNYDEWFKSLNENERTTYFLGQEGKVSKEAWDYQQKKIEFLLGELYVMSDAIRFQETLDKLRKFK